MIWKIIPQFLTCLVALIIANLDYLEYDKKTLKFKILLRALYVCLFLLFSISIFVTIQDDLEKKGEIKELSGKLDRVTNQLTGGDSYCYIQFFSMVGEDNLVIAFLMNDGEYPLYDVQILMGDLHKLQNLQWRVPMPEEEVKKTQTRISVGPMGPRSGAELARFNLPSELDAYGFNIWISTRYKRFAEQVRFKRFEGHWKFAHRLVEETGQENKLIWENISKEFLSAGFAEEIWKFPPASK